MKKTALIGASGFAGSAILNELLSRGYQVEALVRNPDKGQSRKSSAYDKES